MYRVRVEICDRSSSVHYVYTPYHCEQPPVPQEYTREVAIVFSESAYGRNCAARGP